MVTAINDYWQKRLAHDTLSTELLTHTQDKKLLWAKADDIAACTANVPTWTDDVSTKEREIVQLDSTCISKNRITWWATYST